MTRSRQRKLRKIQLVPCREPSASFRSTFSARNALAVGMRWVLVNSVPVIADGKMTGAKPGQMLRGPGYTAVDAHR